MSSLKNIYYFGEKYELFFNTLFGSKIFIIFLSSLNFYFTELNDLFDLYFYFLSLL
jgi:hypothetical protein